MFLFVGLSALVNALFNIRSSFQFIPRELGFVTVFAGCVLISLIAALCTQLNKFSLHATYRMASYVPSSPPPIQLGDSAAFSDFDEHDSLNMYPPRCAPISAPGNSNQMRLFPRRRNDREYHQRQKYRLAVDRKAASFTASPLHCGCPHLGYRSNLRYGNSPSVPPNSDRSIPFNDFAVNNQNPRYSLRKSRCRSMAKIRRFIFSGTLLPNPSG